MATYKRDFILSSGIGLSAEKIYINSATNSTTISTGSLILSGGAGIAKSLSIGGTLQLFNGNNFIAFKSSSTANAIYTLPDTYPSTGTSVLQSSTSGILSWVPMVAGGTSGGSGTVDAGLQNRLAIYPSAGTLVTNSDVSYVASKTQLSFGNIAFVGTGNSAISITGVGNGGQILTTWATLNAGLSLDASNASLRIVGDTNAGTTLVDLGIYDNSGFPTGNWNSKYLFPKSTSAIFVNGLSITNSTSSTSSSTGALIITGGVGIGQTLYTSSSYANSISGVVLSNSIITSGTWAGSIITGFYGGTGYNSYTKGDILVGAGSTFIKLAVGTDNYVLTADSSQSSGLRWAVTASTGVTTLNSLTSTIQYFSTGTSGSTFNISSSGSTHTFNIPIAGTASTGLVSTLSQSFAGVKTFTNAVVISDSTGSSSYTTGALTVSGGVGIGGTLNVQGDFNVQGTFTTINSTTLNVADKNIELGSVTSPTDITAQGGGILLKGATDKSIFWYSGVGFSSSESFNLASGNVYKIGQSTVLSDTTLGSSVIFSSLQTAGIITSGTWSATAITAFYGGTGYVSYTIGDLLVGAGTTLYKLPVGTNNYVLTADSTAPGGVKWAVAASTGVTTINSLTASIQNFAVGISGSGFNISSSGSTHTFNIPIAGTASTGLISTEAQTIAGQKTFSSTIIGNLSGFANTALTLSVANAFTNSAHFLYFGPNLTGSGVAVSANPAVSFNPSSLVLSSSGIAVTSSAASISTSSGALTVSGGVGVGGSIYVGSNVVTSDNIVINSQKELRLNNALNTFYTGFKSNASANTTYTLPAAFPSTGTSVLQSDTSGILNWVPMTATSSSFGVTAENINVNPASADASHFIIFSPRSSGSGVALSTESALVYNPSIDRLYSSGISVTSSIASTTTATGALIVSGGAGIAQSVSIGGRLQIFNGSFYSAFVSAATGNTLYTLPATSPAIGSSYLISTSGGVMSWSPLPVVTLNALTATSQTFVVGVSGSGFSISSIGATHTFNIPIAGTAATGLVNTLSQSFSGVKTFTSGLVSNIAIGNSSGGTGYASYVTGELLVGTGSTLSKLSVGTNNFALIADSSQITGVRWGLITNDSLQNSFIGLGNTSVGLGSTLGLVGTGISITYENNSIRLRSAVAITSSYPLGALQGDLLWHDEEGSLKIYYDDGQNEGQWVDASQRWGSGQYVTLPGLGAGTIYQMAYYAASGHTVVGDASFVNDTSIGRVTISHGSGSTSTSTGALVVSGSIGVGGTVFGNSVRTDSGFIEKVYSGGNVGAGATIFANWNNGSVQTYTITGNCWLGLPTNMPTGASLTLVISQDAVGGWGMTSNTNIKYAAGNKTISSTANAIDVINMFYTGSTYLAALTTGYS